MASHSNYSNNIFVTDVPSMDYQIGELTWGKGQLEMHGLDPPRVPNKSLLGSTWDSKPHADGTLESVVNQGTRIPPHQPKSAVDGGEDRGDDLVRWFDNYLADTALVPTNSINTRDSHQQEPPSTYMPGTTSKCVVNPSTRVASCSDDVNTTDGEMERARVRAAAYEEIPENFEITGSFENGEVKELFRSLYEGHGMADGSLSLTGTVGTGERDLGTERFTSTSMRSPERTSKHGRSAQREAGDEDEKKGSKISSFSTKRSRAAATHNQSERKRRDKINQRIKTLQKLVPTSSKTDKASMLDEVIEYLKQLQGQIEAMSRMYHFNMMFPNMALQQQQQAFQMSMGGRGMQSLPNNITAMPSALHSTTASFMPITAASAASLVPPDPLASFHLASQSQPMTVEAYSRMAALYQRQYLQSHANLGFKN